MKEKSTPSNLCVVGKLPFTTSCRQKRWKWMPGNPGERVQRRGGHGTRKEINFGPMVSMLEWWPELLPEWGIFGNRNKMWGWNILTFILIFWHTWNNVWRTYYYYYYYYYYYHHHYYYYYYYFNCLPIYFCK